MRYALQFALLISATAALTACGGGSGTSATLSGGGGDSASFTSWNAVQRSSSITVNGISQSGTIAYNTVTDLITSRTGDASISGASYSATYDSNGLATAVTVTPAGGSAMTFTRGTDTFGALIINHNIDAVVSGDGTKSAFAANPYDFGWSYQTFGVWATGAVTGSGAYGAISIGAETAGSAIPTSGTATYTGNSAGRYVNSAGNYWLTGSAMTAATNFSSRSISFSTTGTQITDDLLTVSNNSNLNMSGTLTYSAATNQIAGSVTTVGGLTGSVNGRFYGPTAQEIGGTFYLTSGSNALEGYAGAFGGKKP
jgi:hypothetical protein